MTTHEITSTKDLRVFFPELARTNKFKRKLDELFATGFTMTLDHAEKPFFAFSNKDKTARFKFRFKANGVRAVNMSWGGSLRGIEEALEAYRMSLEA